jgi:hypothetical protein
MNLGILVGINAYAGFNAEEARWLIINQLGPVPSEDGRA